MNKEGKLISGLLALTILLFAWFLQGRLFLSWDASWLMHAASRLWAGGTYSSSYFETNPPLILFLYLPAVLVSQVFSWSPIMVFRVYIFLMALLSLVFCTYLARPLFTKKDSLLFPAFMLSVEIAFLILPLHELGQRDHLMVVLSLPYLLSFTCRLQKRSPNLFAGSNILVGLMAALGFALKPHFLLTPLLLEAYGCIRQKKLSFCLRPETLTMALMLLLYGLVIDLFFPDYISFIIPFSLRHYYDGISSPWLDMLTQPLLLLSGLPLLLVVVFYAKNKHKDLSLVLLLALCGFILSYLTQRTVFYYHLIPLFSMTLILLVLFFGEFIQESGKSKSEFSFALVLGLFIFALPLYQGYKVYDNWALHKSKLQPLITFLQKEALAQPVYFFASTTVYVFPTIDYAGVKFASRIPFMWMVSGLLSHKTPTLADQADKKILGDMIADDFNKEKPLLVLIDDAEQKPYIQEKNFDYLAYFSENENFQREWQNYSYLTTVKEKGVYTLKVYKRKVLMPA